MQDIDDCLVRGGLAWRGMGKCLSERDVFWKSEAILSTKLRELEY